MVSPATDYLRAASAEMGQSGYTLDCVAHACKVAELLLAEGAEPWIGRLRDRRGNFHGPLIPRRFELTWNTHYVCCAGDRVFDPLAGEPLAVEEFAQHVFGKPLPIEHFLSAGRTKELLERGELRKACR